MSVTNDASVQTSLLQTGEANNAARAHERAESVAEMEDAAQAFESIFIQQLFNEMRQAMGTGGDGLGMDIYQGMFDQQVAEEAAGQGGIGLASLLLQSWGVDAVEPTTDQTDESITRGIFESSSRLTDGQPANAVQPPESTGWQTPVPFEGETSHLQIVDLSGETGKWTGGAMGIETPPGVAIRPVAPGRVIRVDPAQDGGNLIEVAHPSGWTTRYTHPADPFVSEGEWVDGRAPLSQAELGDDGEMLRFEFRRGSYDFDPGVVAIGISNSESNDDASSGQSPSAGPQERSTAGSPANDAGSQ